MAPMTLPATFSFPEVRKLDTLRGREAADELGNAYRKLYQAGIRDGATRLKKVDEFAGKLDYPTLERLADPDQSISELADTTQRKTRLQHVIRNTTALIPLLLTWAMLSWASVLYHDDLAGHPEKSTTPFLMLWQQHFGHGGLVPTFAEVAFIDFVVLAVVLAYTVQVHRAENSAAAVQADISGSLYAAMSALAIAVERSAIATPASAEEWAKAAEDWASATQEIITSALAQTEALSKTGREVIEEARASLKDIHDEGRGFIKEFSLSTAETLRAVREDNAQFIERTAKEARETLQVLVERQMNPLLTQLSTMLTEFSTHHATYRASVSGLQDAVTEINSSAKVLAASATTYKDVATKISTDIGRAADAQDGFVKRLDGTAKSLDQASAAMQAATETLKTDLRDKLDVFARDVTQASADLKDVQRELKPTAAALNKAASSLTNVTLELKKVEAALHGGTSPVERVRQPWKRIFFR